MKRFSCLILTALVCLTLLVSAGAEPYEEYTSGDLNAAQPSKAEIRNKYHSVAQAEYLYDEKPSYTAPYATGKLSDNFLQSGLDYLNYVRFVAKLPDVKMDPALNENAQYGAVLLTTNGILTHEPGKPADMDDDFYAKGYEATTTSNLAYGSATYTGSLEGLRTSILDYMHDIGSVGNYSSVGHRRWLLNPVLGKVGFGYVLNTSPYFWDQSFTATKVFDKSGEGCDYDFVSWPASGNFPTELFTEDASWSVTVNLEKYQMPNREDLTIQLTRYSDGLTWIFDKDSPASYESGKSYLLKDSMSYGVRNCIVFRPALNYFGEYEGRYWVCINGLKTLEGEDAAIYYDVEFFDLEQPDCEKCSYQVTVTEPKCYVKGYTAHTCTVCGHCYKDNWTDPAGHTYDDHLCIRCGELEEGFYGHGTAGDNVTWSLDYAGNLSFSGYGDMYDYSDWGGSNPAPWATYMSLIKTVTMDDRITSLSSNAFGYCRKLTKVDLSEGLTRIGSDAFAVCESLTTLTIPDGVTSIGQWAFSNCSNLTGLELPHGITAIEFGTFINCGALETLEIPGSVTAIGSSAFSDCAALTRIVIPEGVTELASGAFQGCTALKSVELPDSLTEIGYDAFKNCASLQHIDLPENLQTVNYGTFSGSGLQSVAFHGPAPQYISSDAFQGVTAEIHYPAGDSTWTEEARGQYGGSLIWIPSEDIPSHNWIAATCTQPLTCADCGKTVGMATGHIFGGWYRDQEPTCTEPGWDKRECNICGFAETEEVQPSGHWMQWYEIDPTCTEGGVVYQQCLCGYTVTERETLPLGHTDSVEARAPSCAWYGYEYRKCVRCGREENIQLPMLEHSFSEYDRIENCADGGIHTRRCENCGYEETSPIEPKEHNFILEEHTDPTCYNPGYTHYGCTDCLIGRSESTDPLGHDYEIQVLTEATCEAPGEEIKTCARCGESKQYKSASLGHDYVETVLKEPDCATHGDLRMDCSRCGKSILTTINALGHSWSGNFCTRCGISNSGGFRDVVPGTYYAVPVNWAVEQKITTGTSDTTFSPEDPCTRGQVVTFLWRAAGSPEPVTTENPFTDVAKSDYFYKAVLWAVEKGITKGMTDTTFGPASPCTRAQVATFLWRYAGEPKAGSQSHSFTDITKDYYYDAVLWAVDHGITNGTSDTTFSPANTCTRAQIVTFLYRFLA